MIYILVKWIHELNDEPVLLFSELDDKRWERRKVEVYADGRMGYASEEERLGNAGLGKVSVPPLAEIASDPQFDPTDISRMDFERIWVEAHKLGKVVIK
jgi:hypothetical protein